MISALLLLPNQFDSIDQILTDPNLKGAITGVYIGRADGTTLYERNADFRLMPASNEKILSVYFALSTLGPAFKPQTKFWKEGKDLYVHATGDPLLSAEQLYNVRKNLNPAPGSSVYVKQDFAPGVGPGWEYDDLPHAYAAPITAFTLDAGRFVVKTSQGEPVVPSYAGINIVRKSSKGNANLVFDRESGRLTVSGTLPKTSENIERFALPNPARSAALALGGTLHNTQTLPNREPDYIVTGKPISDLAKLCLEPSDNMIAEHLLLLAANKLKPLQSNPFSQAAASLNNFYFETVGVEPFTISAADGSGLSRHNLVTARSMAQVLRHVWMSDLKDLFLEALPKPGEGTMANRLKDMPIYAKTGTLSGACSLSGYVMKSGEPVIFSIIMNHHVKPSGEIRKIQDKIVQEIYSNLK